MLNNLKQTLLRREHDMLSEELDEMILLGEDEDLFSDDELNLSEEVSYSDSDFDDIPEDDINLGDDDLDELLDESKEEQEEIIDSELTEEMEYAIAEGMEFECFNFIFTESECASKGKPCLAEDEVDEMVEDDEDDDLEEEIDDDLDVELTEFTTPEFLAEAEEEVEEVEEVENSTEEDLSESLFFAEFMEV